MQLHHNLGEISNELGYRGEPVQCDKQGAFVFGPKGFESSVMDLERQTGSLIRDHGLEYLEEC